MSIHKKQLREIVSQTLTEIGLYSEDALNLIMGTAAQESAFGTYIKQLGSGPALGIFQMEPNTFNDIIENYLAYKPALLGKIIKASNIKQLNADALRYNLKLAICLTRVHYLRVPHPLPSNLNGYADYWKKHYNTYLGAGTTEEYIKNYKKHIDGYKNS